MSICHEDSLFALSFVHTYVPTQPQTNPSPSTPLKSLSCQRTEIAVFATPAQATLYQDVLSNAAPKQLIEGI